MQNNYKFDAMSNNNTLKYDVYVQTKQLSAYLEYQLICDQILLPIFNIYSILYETLITSEEAPPLAHALLWFWSEFHNYPRSVTH
jgi:hypothetical protein